MYEKFGDFQLKLMNNGAVFESSKALIDVNFHFLLIFFYLHNKIFAIQLILKEFARFLQFFKMVNFYNKYHCYFLNYFLPQKKVNFMLVAYQE